jgi:hypothetical protein
LRPLAKLLLLAALGLAACGNDRAEVPATRVVGEDPVKRLKFPRYGVEVSVPTTASVQRTARPGVFRLFLGQPLVSLFAYPRREEIPRRERDLRVARKRLIKEVKRRDPDYELLSSRLFDLAGAKAIELVGDQTISRGRLRTRSVHVYKRDAEYVIELLAPPAEFERTDQDVFGPLLRSLKLSGEVKQPQKRKEKKKRQ